MPFFQKKFHLKLVYKSRYLYCLDASAQCFMYILFMDSCPTIAVCYLLYMGIFSRLII